MTIAAFVLTATACVAALYMWVLLGLTRRRARLAARSAETRASLLQGQIDALDAACNSYEEAVQALRAEVRRHRVVAELSETLLSAQGGGE